MKTLYTIDQNSIGNGHQYYISHVQ